MLALSVPCAPQAELLQEMGAWAEARALFKEVAQGHSEALGAEHELTVKAARNLGVMEDLL